MRRSPNVSGLVVAGLGFFLTRFTVTLAIYDDPVRFYLAGVIPLAIGLGLAAFGVALTVADVDPALVRTTALWCVIGFATMAVLVGLTLLGERPDGVSILSAIREETALSNFLIGGSVGGTLTGLYAARNRRQRRQLRQQANRLVTLNRILRHEVLNSVSAIRGYIAIDQPDDDEATAVIDEQSRDIQRVIEDVKYLTQQTDTGRSRLQPISLGDSLADSIETIAERYPDADIEPDEVPGDVTVLANKQLSTAFTHLLENAIVHAEDSEPTVSVNVGPSTVTVSVSDDGPGLPDTQQSLLETGDIEEFDDPTTGFGLNVVRLLVESYDGSIDTDVGNHGSTVSITLKRTDTAAESLGPNRTDLAQVRPALPHLLVGVVASLVAGVTYGLTSELLGGSVAAIGVFYGTADPVVGWLTHQFHSIVFGFAYIGLLSFGLERFRTRIRTYVGIGIAWALCVWFVAASIVAPVWLELLGIPVGIPTFQGTLLAAHLVWGITLAILTAIGYSALSER